MRCNYEDRPDKGPCVPETIEERYSYGIYAGRWCDPHWKQSGYRDAGTEGDWHAEIGEDYAGERYNPLD